MTCSLCAHKMQCNLHLTFPLRTCSGAGDDHGPAVRRCVLCRHWYRSRTQVSERCGTSGFLQPAELHRSHQCAFRSTTTRWHWQEGKSLPYEVPSVGYNTGVSRLTTADHIWNECRQNQRNWVLRTFALLGQNLVRTNWCLSPLAPSFCPRLEMFMGPVLQRTRIEVQHSLYVSTQFFLSANSLMLPEGINVRWAHTGRKCIILHSVRQEIVYFRCCKGSSLWGKQLQTVCTN